MFMVLVKNVCLVFFIGLGFLVVRSSIRISDVDQRKRAITIAPLYMYISTAEHL